MTEIKEKKASKSYKLNRNFIKSCIKTIFPVALWLLLFTFCKYIPTSIRPDIHVELLPTLENYIFRTPVGLIVSSLGAIILSKLCLSSINYWYGSIAIPVLLRGIYELSYVTPNRPMDALLFLPYGVFHYLSPIVFSFYCFYLRKFDLVKSYLWALGWMNLCGVITQIVLPCAPPWYNEKYGTALANYSMNGDPAGLINVDLIFGTKVFQNMFGSSPLVFGAFPSLHSGMALMVMFFGFKISTRLGFILICYVCWIWSATIYFHHHYMVDLLAGFVYASVSYRAFYKESKKLALLPLVAPDVHGSYTANDKIEGEETVI